MKTAETRARLLNGLMLAALVLAGATLFRAALASLHWRFAHDTPLMLYTGFLVDGGAVPYRDFFDMNLPGTYLAMWAVGQVFGWGDVAIRAFDLLSLGAISLLTACWLGPFGRRPVAAAVIAFGLCYLGGGIWVNLQREYLVLVPFAGMLALVRPGARARPVWRAFAAGLLVGATLTIKPHMLIAAIPALLAFLLDPAVAVRRRAATVAMVAGAAIPAALALAYLACTGGLVPFLDMARNYWPLYTHMTGSFTPIAGWARVEYLLAGLAREAMTVYLPLALLGLVALVQTPGQSRRAWLLLGLLAGGGLYPAFAGQFWMYHWLPFRYLAICAAAQAARPLVAAGNGWGQGLPAAALALWLAALSVFGNQQAAQARAGLGAAAPPKNGAPDEIAQFLRDRIVPGDKVQPLDWTGGAVHGMLMAQAPLATRFMYDFHFYHHIDSSYIMRLRGEFMGELTAARPRFIIQVFADKPWPDGPNTTREFPELDAFLASAYRVAAEGRTYRILERAP